MDSFKQQIQQKLIANILVDKCTHCDYLIFRDAWCTQERVIRFTTAYFRKLFSWEENEKGPWKTGDCVMYEVENDGLSLTINCVLNSAGIGYGEISVMDNLIKVTDANKTTELIILKSWKLVIEKDDINTLIAAFDQFIQKAVPYWEQEIQEKLASLKQEKPILKEGAAEYVTLNKYERNPKAREACLAAHGTACQVCGIDFGKVYGPEFAGKIEVHHIVPISEIGEEYVVDPIKDLVPVCPNCHTALHSKKDGVYTVKELKELLRK